MHISIVTIGGRGDVQPFVALGLGLQRVGHTVQIVTNTEFQNFVQRYGLTFAPIGVNIRAALEGDLGAALLKSGDTPLKFLQEIATFVSPLVEQGIKDAYAACQTTDLLLSSLSGDLISEPVGEKLKIPVVHTLTFPVSPTRAFPSALFPTMLQGGGLFNLLTHFAGQYVPWFFLRPLLNRVRVHDLGLPPLPLAKPYGYDMYTSRVLYGYSPTVLPKPADWGRHIDVTGYWFLDQAAQWQPSAQLIDFIDAGSRPLCISYGSMGGKNAEQVLALTLEAVRRTTHRAILITGWRGLAQSDLPEQIFVADSIPHDWLLPRVSGLIHHGGAGTTAAAFRAGLPQMIVPFLGDQLFWSFVAHRLAVAPAPLSQERVTVEKMVNAITTVVGNPESTFAIKARALGEKIRAEDGVSRAVELITQFRHD